MYLDGKNRAVLSSHRDSFVAKVPGLCPDASSSNAFAIIPPGRYASCAAFLTDDTNHIIKNKTMKTIIFGILLGIAAGIIDVIPMIIKKLTWDANISAFLMWVIVGFLIATTDLNMNPILKGILIAFLVLTPCAILIGWKEPKSLIPIFVMTLILGGLLGFLIPKLINN